MPEVLDVVRSCLRKAGYDVDPSGEVHEEYVLAVGDLNKDIQFSVMTYIIGKGAAVQTFIPKLYPFNSVDVLTACLVLQSELTYVRFTIDEDNSTISLHIDMPVSPFPADLYTGFMSVLPELLLKSILPAFIAIDPEAVDKELQNQGNYLKECREELERSFKNS